MGVDDTEESAAALRWAAAEARPGVDALHVVHAFALLSFAESSWTPAVQANDARRASARTLVNTVIRHTRARRPGVDVDGSAIVGAPVPVLADLSQIADLVVIGGVSGDGTGRRGPGRHIGRRVATRAACPIVVVPDGAVPTSAPTRPVAVLLHGQDLRPDVLDFGFAAAARRGTSLLVVHSWTLGVEPDAQERSEIVQWETEHQKLLDAALAGCQERFARVPVLVQLRQESSYLATRELHESAQLLVVGRAGHEAPGLGPLPLLALRKPLCPVAVIPGAGARAHRITARWATGDADAPAATGRG